MPIYSKAVRPTATQQGTDGHVQLKKRSFLRVRKGGAEDLNLEK